MMGAIRSSEVPVLLLESHISHLKRGMKLIEHACLSNTYTIWTHMDILASKTGAFNLAKIRYVLFSRYVACLRYRSCRLPQNCESRATNFLRTGRAQQGSSVLSDSSFSAVQRCLLSSRFNKKLMLCSGKIR